MNKEKGFTLIEIVMVIILLGILAAVAIPRFIDMTGKAKESSTKGILGGVRGAVSIAYANNAVRGHPGYPATAAALSAVLADERFPDNPYSTDTPKNDVEETTTKSIGQLGASGKDWVYNTSKGQFWSGIKGGVAANGF